MWIQSRESMKLCLCLTQVLCCIRELVQERFILSSKFLLFLNQWWNCEFGVTLGLAVRRFSISQCQQDLKEPQRTVPAQIQGGNKILKMGGVVLSSNPWILCLQEISEKLFLLPTWHNLLLPAHTVPELTDRNCAARQRWGELESHSHLS